ncbi:C2H2-type zinc finger protein [Halorubellus sp. JP-L1]|nr:C2H2-type zinc finger protein [Halorubellus sp. JP-L1]
MPDDADAHRCPYCSRPFADPARVDLHVGLKHYDVCDDDEAAAFEDAYTGENEMIRLYRLKATAAIVLLYFGFLMVYAFFA